MAVATNVLTVGKHGQIVMMTPMMIGSKVCRCMY